MDYLIVFAAIVGVAIVCYMLDRVNRIAFERRFPPISDDEFMARCKPGTNREIALTVRRIVSTQLGVDYERIYPESLFVNDLGC